MNQQDRAFMITFSSVLGVLVVFAFVIFFIAGAIAHDPRLEEARDAVQLASSSERLAPVGQVVVVGSEEATSKPTEPAPAAAMTGEQVYATNCSACHAAGVLEAPKLGDQAAWASRYEQGLETLVSNALGGINAMPAKGGNASLSDANIHDSVVYMLQESAISVEGAAASAEPAAADTATATSEPAASEQVAATTEQAAAAPADASPSLIPADIDVAAGQEVYGVACFACHDQGIAGAPKLADQAAWAPRLKKGWEVLVEHALQGFNTMPPKGGRVDLPDEQIVSAVGYLVDQAQ